MAAACPPMAWGVVMLHADEVPHRRQCCQVLALSQSPFSSVSPWPPPAPGTPLGPALYNPGGALQPGIQHQAPRHFSCTCSHIVGYTLIHKPINNRHTNYKQRNYEKWVSSTTIHAEHNGPGPQHSLITIHSHTGAHTCQLQPGTSNNLLRVHGGIGKICCPLSAASGLTRHKPRYLWRGFLQQHQQSLQHHVGETGADWHVICRHT